MAAAPYQLFSQRALQASKVAVTCSAAWDGWLMLHVWWIDCLIHFERLCTKATEMVWCFIQKEKITKATTDREVGPMVAKTGRREGKCVKDLVGIWGAISEYGVKLIFIVFAWHLLPGGQPQWLHIACRLSTFAWALYQYQTCFQFNLNVSDISDIFAIFSLILMFALACKLCDQKVHLPCWNILLLRPCTAQCLQPDDDIDHDDCSADDDGDDWYIVMHCTPSSKHSSMSTAWWWWLRECMWLRWRSCPPGY